MGARAVRLTQTPTHSGSGGGSSVGRRNGASAGHAPSGSYQYHSPRFALESHVRCDRAPSSAFARRNVRSGMPAAAAAASTSASRRGPAASSCRSHTVARSRSGIAGAGLPPRPSADRSTAPAHSTTGCPATPATR